ncbi:caspase family protein [Saccharothrix sp. NRRL B-16314]|uniref:caspase family protein n=1 Tax=Saccharothrix sp. NRRL B-16314 TaxID=1463825 RepID=UPI000524E939|nr:caspase family protein [Saccharothrix sp. NRRL B-16314]
MANFAIVVGIDHYENENLALKGAVADALRFADWATDAGGVPQENLRLLLSPHEPVPQPHGPATSEGIRTALYEVSSGGATDADRLFFHYAGHGLTSPGIEVGAPGEPVLVPSNVKVWGRDKNLLVLFSAVVTELRGVAPLEQFFFIDACRDLALQDSFRPMVGSLGAAWVPERAGDPVVANQHILYATSLGQRAAANAVLNQGVFTPLLVEGLRGASTALAWSHREQQYVVRFSTLSQHVKTAVGRRLAGMSGAEGFVQQPQMPMTGAEDVVMTRVPPDEVPAVTVHIQVAPGAARRGCTLSVASPQPGFDGLRKTFRPPVARTSVVELPPFDYTFRACADGFTEAKESHQVYESMVIPLELKGAHPLTPPSAPSDPPTPEGGPYQPHGGSYQPGGGPYLPGGGPYQPDGVSDVREPAARQVPALESTGDDVPSTGRLEVRCPDKSATIAVCDNENRQVATGFGDVVADLPPGLYRVRMVLPDGGGERLVEVEPGGTTSTAVEASASRLAPHVVELLATHRIRADEFGYVRLANRMPPIARPSLASLLAFAALAANGAEAPRLRELGVADVRGDRPMALVILGSNREGGLPVGAELVVRGGDGRTLGMGSFEILAEFPVAAQRYVALPPDQVRLELRIPGHTPTRYAVSPLPGRVAVLVVVLEKGSQVEVQQYQLPAMAHDSRGRIDLRGLRRIELAQRYYSTGGPAPQGRALVDLLSGKWLDPLLGCVSGYRLVQQGDAKRFARVALRNMLRDFPRLPDSHVLAGLCLPDYADKHFEEALALGVPTFSAGLVGLYEWMRRTGRKAEPDFVDIATNLVPGSPWTAWAADRPTFLVHDGTFDVPTFGRDDLVDAPQRLHDVIAAVCRVEPQDTAHEFSGTGFLIAPGVVATSPFVVEHCLDRTGRIPKLVRPVQVDFGAEKPPTPQQFTVVDIREPATNPGVVLLHLEPGPNLPEPLRLAPAPVRGTLVAVVGHPVCGTAADGLKHVMPGRVLGTDTTVVRHDCTTGPGTAGAPLIRVDNGEVLGIHFAANHDAEREGRALPLRRL